MLGQFPSHPHSTWIARGRSASMEGPLFAPRRDFHGQAAPHHHCCTRAPGFHKNKTTDALQVGTARIMVAADGSFATAIAKDNHKEGEIQGQIRQHSRLINTYGVRQTRIGVNKIECDAAGCKQERCSETSTEMRSMLIKIVSNGFDHTPGQKGADESFVKGRHKPHCDEEMPKITRMKQDPAANHRTSCGQARVARR